MEKFTLRIEGMTCPHCKKALEGAIGQLEGVHSVEVNLSDSTATVEASTGEMLEKVKETVKEAGYTPA